MNILVTGGAGFIGAWLVQSLVEVGHTVRVVDNLSPQIHGAMPSLHLDWIDHPSVHFERGDVRDVALMDRLLEGVDAVVHLAAETGTGQSMYRIAHYYDVNVQATASLLEAIALRHRQVRRIVLASSRSVYGEGAYELAGALHVPPPRSTTDLAAAQWEPTGPAGELLRLIATPETAPPMPASVYAASKLANEQLGRVFADAYGTSVVALRFQNVYGERQSLRNPYTGILSIFSNRMRQGLPINIFEDGLESRDFVHVSDIVRAIGLALTVEMSRYEVVNVGAGEPASVIHMAAQLKQLLDSQSELVVTGDYRAGDIRHCYADLSRARALMGYAPQVTLREGLARFIDWVRTQPVLVDRSEQAQRELNVLGLGRAAC